MISLTPSDMVLPLIFRTFWRRTTVWSTKQVIKYSFSFFFSDSFVVIDLQGYTSAHWAAKRGDVEILSLLFKSGANLDVPAAFESKMLPIHWAASDGKINSIRFLLDHRQDINAQDANGCTPIVIATQYNQIPAVIYLAKNGADLTLRDSSGDTPLHWAAYKGHEELIGLHLHFSPHDLDSDDTFGQTPLHLAALKGNHDVVEFLMVDFKADHTKRDKNGLTPLELSVKKSQLKCEWVIRRLTSNNSLALLAKLGMSRLKDKRYFFVTFLHSLIRTNEYLLSQDFSVSAAGL